MTLNRVTSLLGLVILGVSLVPATGQNPPAPAAKKGVMIPDTVEAIKNVEFGKGGNKPLRMDIYRPKVQPDKPMPVIVYIHGGAWFLGGRGIGAVGGPAGQFLDFAAEGYFCVSIEYRLAKADSKFPAQIEDCKCAIRYLRAHAKDYNIDPDRIGAWGSSAGGHLAALLGTAGDAKELEGTGGWQDQSSQVQAVVDWYGPANLVSMSQTPGRDHNSAKSPEGNLIGGAVSENLDKAKAASPITYVSKEDPPFLVMHGTKDGAVPFKQSEEFAAALKQAGVDVTFIPVEGAGHDFEKKSPDLAFPPVKEFLDKHLKNKPPAQQESSEKGEPSAGEDYSRREQAV